MSIYDDIVRELRETARIILNRIENIEKKLGIDVNKIDKERTK
tara:strand:- start:78 stop:206 length:129 start_codon:yes stop_codon:yes gene_type:complete